MDKAESESEAPSGIDLAVDQIRSKGLAHIHGDVYLSGVDLESFKLMQAGYFKLGADTYGGNRYRAYQRFLFLGGELYAIDNRGYSQSPEYNDEAGGKVRVFPPLDQDMLGSPVLKHILKTDVAIARGTGIVPFDGPVRIGIHLVRYQPMAGEVSYASPTGPHKDDEPLVFVHLINESSNVVGGENTVGSSPKQFEAVIKLEEPLETLCVTHKQFHSVIPLGLRSGKVGYRDILLVTFEEERDIKEDGRKSFSLEC